MIQKTLTLRLLKEIRIKMFGWFLIFFFCKDYLLEILENERFEVQFVFNFQTTKVPYTKHFM